MRTAGLLQYPPAMYAQIEPWMVSIWCGHVADKFAYSVQDKKSVVLQALSELEAEYQRVQAWWEHVKDKSDQRYSFKIPKWTSYGIQYIKVVVSTKSEMWDPETGHIVLNLTGRPHEGNRVAIYDLKGIVVLTQDADPQDRTRYWLIKSIKRYMTMAINNLDAEVGYKGYDSDKDRDVYQAAMKYTSKVKGYTASAAQKFPVNLTGWKYLGEMGLNPLPITVKLDFVGHTKRGGQWSPQDWELQVDMPQKMPESAKELEGQVVRIRAILIHELRHVAQTLLQQSKNLKSVGVPTRVPNQSKAVNRWDLPHALRPVEFYPRLGDEVSAFLHRYSTGWIPSHINQWVSTSPFFQALKKHKPDDWRKAVKHFVEQVQKARAERLVKKFGGQMQTSRQQMIERVAAQGNLMKKEMEKLLAPHMDEPDDADLLLVRIKDNLYENLVRIFKGVENKMTPFKAEDTQHLSDGRPDAGIWYTVEYPSAIWTRFRINLSLPKLWGKVVAPANIKELLKPGDEPKCEGRLETLFAKMVQESLEGQDLLPSEGLIPDELEDTILNWAASNGTISDDVEATDPDTGEQLPEGPSLEIDWRMTFGKYTLSLATQGENLKGTMELKVNVEIRRVNVPGDYEWGRR